MNHNRPMDPEKLKALHEALDAEEWVAVCPVCGAKLEGPLSELRKHKHEPADA